MKLPYTDFDTDIENGAGPATALFINPRVPRPTPAKGQCLVKIHAFGLNRMDLSQREGRYPVPPQASRILGVEFSGVIIQINENDGDGFKEGDEVFGLAYGGRLFNADYRKNLKSDKMVPYRRLCRVYRG
jgi:NADPH2:quinone reductase